MEVIDGGRGYAREVVIEVGINEDTGAVITVEMGASPDEDAFISVFGLDVG